MATTRHPPEQDERWERTVTGGSGKRRWGRRLLLVVLVLVLLVAAVGLASAMNATANMERVTVGSLASGSSPMQILVVGSDSREGLTAEQQQELTTGDVGGERTDTIFLMTISGGKVALLAFPRDLFVTRCDGSGGRINAAMGIGGPTCLVQTVRDLSGIPVSHFMEVNFLGFRDIVDAVGGVDICLDKAIQDDFAGVDLPAGCQELDGRQALGYVRVRKVDNDLERIKRQQRFLRSLAQEVMSPSTSLNPPRLFQVSGAVGEALTTDEGFGPIDLARLGFGARGLASGASVMETVPTTGANVGGAAVLRPIEDEARQLFDSFRDGSILGRATGGPAPSEITVDVLNGAGVTGLAGQTAEALREAGFQVGQVADAPEQVDATVVRFPADQRDQAEVLARALPLEPRLEETSEVSTVTLLLGPDASGA